MVMAGDGPVRSGIEPPKWAALWSDDRPGEVDWKYLYEQYADSLRRLIARRLPRGGPVDDLLQETFFRAIRSTPLIDTVRAPWPFLATVAGRAVADWWNREGARRAASSSEAHVPISQVTVEFPGSDEHAVALDRVIRVRRALLALKPRHRRALYLHEGADCSYETLVELDRGTPQAMRSLVGRARACFVEQYRRMALALVVWRRTRLERFSVPLSSEVLSALGGVVVITLVAGAATQPLASATTSVRTRPAALAPTEAHPIPSGTASAARAIPTQAEPHQSIPPPVVKPTQSGEQPPSGPSRASLPVEAGGGLTNTPQESTVSIWITLTDPLGGEVTAGTTTRCDQGEIAARKCEIMRPLPGSS